jgi:pectate lyase
MPPVGHVSLSDQQTLSQWISAAATGISATPTPSPTATPAPTATPTPTATPAPNTFKSLQANIFQPKCVGCHSAGNADGGFAYDTYTSVKASVNTASPTSSKVYTATNSGSMPKGGSTLTSAQLAALLQWIQAGALNN